MQKLIFVVCKLFLFCVHWKSIWTVVDTEYNIDRQVQRYIRWRVNLTIHVYILNEHDKWFQRRFNYSTIKDIHKEVEDHLKNKRNKFDGSNSMVIDKISEIKSKIDKMCKGRLEFFSYFPLSPLLFGNT